MRRRKYDCNSVGINSIRILLYDQSARHSATRTAIYEEGHTWTWARLQTQTGKSKAFLYYFDHHPEYSADSPKAGFGAAHSDEMPLVFHQFGPPGRPNENDVDAAMSEPIMSYWTDFAKYGEPNGEGLPEWPVYNDAKPEAIHFLCSKAQVGPVVNTDGLGALDEYSK